MQSGPADDCSVRQPLPPVQRPYRIPFKKIRECIWMLGMIRWCMLPLQNAQYSTEQGTQTQALCKQGSQLG